MVECKFCGGSELRDAVMLPVCKMRSGMLYLMKDQTLPGRMLLAYKDHIRKLSSLSRDEYRAFMDDVYSAAKAINEVFNPDKINYFVFGDKSDHLHIHLVPKYKDKVEWGAFFTMDRVGWTPLSDAGYQELVCALNNSLQNGGLA